jgi:peroxiredoxin
MAVRLGLTFPLLSDPAMRVIRAYGMKTAGMMGHGDMGYVVIDLQGRIRAKSLDRRFGDNVPHITGILEKLKAEG